MASNPPPPAENVRVNVSPALTNCAPPETIRRLLEAQAHLAAIVASSDDAIISKTLEGIVTSWNEGAQRIFGYSAAEMIGQPVLKLIPVELKDEEALILSKLKSGERISHYETIRVRKDGARVPISLTVSPVRDSEGALIGASKIARDITEKRCADENLRHAKEQAEAASRAKDNFLAALSHELRTPLTPVLMTAAALREDDRLPADVKAELEMIKRNVLLEARLIDDLLDLTRITHGKLTLHSEPCDAHSIIGMVVEIVRDEAREKKITITLKLAALRTRVLGDPVRLQQAFWNLLHNAVKFTPEGGHICICSQDCVGALSPGQGRIRIAVEDDGAGFDAAVSGKIFEPFEQGVARETSQRGGLGLGLAIARAIVDMHGGAIGAKSDGPGRGSIFTVELPACPAPEGVIIDGSVAGELNIQPRPARPMRLLVVEDHTPTRQVLTRLLIRAGHAVTDAATVAEAREIAAADHFDVVISDLGLPDGTGLELMRDLRAIHEHLRGIALSGYGMDEDLRRSREAGFTAHLVKPIDVNELRGTLRQISGSLCGHRAQPAAGAQHPPR